MGLRDFIRKLAPYALAAAIGCSSSEKKNEEMYLTPDDSVVTQQTANDLEIYYAQDKILVEVQPGTSKDKVNSLAQQLQGEITGSLAPLNWYELRVSEAQESLAQARQSPIVKNAELNYAGKVNALDIENPAAQDFAWGQYKIKLPEAYQAIADKTLEETVVAVLDSGFDLNHPELDSRFLPGYDVGSVDENPTYEDLPEDAPRTHGTRVAGIIAMENNGEGLNGVAYNAKILPIKVLSSSKLGRAADVLGDYFFFSWKVAAGIVKATLDGADVINLSLGWYTAEPSALLQAAATYAADSGVSLVASAGNDNRDAAFNYPSALAEVLSVGATNKEDKRWSFDESAGSNYSLQENSSILTVAAPGENIWSTVPGNKAEDINAGSGTSLAAPFVSGLEALLKSINYSLTSEERRSIIIGSADIIKVAYPGLDYPHIEGERMWRRINAYNAVMMALAGCNPTTENCGVSKEKWIQVEAGYNFSCGLRESGTIKCWKSGESVNSPLGRYLQITVGSGHGCAIRTDNTLECWDTTESPPSGKFTSVDAGGYTTCAISMNGTVTCWGNNEEGQAEPLIGIFTQVSVGGKHACGLRNDGTVQCWGRNIYGQTDSPPGQFLQISAGAEFTCGVRTNDSIECWGLTGPDGQTNPPPGTFIQVSVGVTHSCGIKTDQTIDCWGSDRLSQSDAPLGKFIQVDVSTYHTCSLKENSSIQCWGLGEYMLLE